MHQHLYVGAIQSDSSKDNHRTVAELGLCCGFPLPSEEVQLLLLWGSPWDKLEQYTSYNGDGMRILQRSPILWDFPPEQYQQPPRELAGPPRETATTYMGNAR
jgi:hypothetical protein